MNCRLDLPPVPEERKQRKLHCRQVKGISLKELAQSSWAVQEKENRPKAETLRVQWTAEAL